MQFYLRMFLVSIFMFVSITFSHASSAVKFTKEAIFKSITSISSSVSKTSAKLYADIISKYSTQYGIDPFLIVAIAKVESDFILNQYKDINILIKWMK